MRLNLVQHRLGDPALAAAAGLTPQNATAADHVRLQAACDALTILLEECYHNLPKEDVQRLNADLQRYTQALQRIQPRLQAHGLLALGILAVLLVLASYAFYRTGYQSLAGLQRRGRAQGRWQTLFWLCWALAYLPCAPWTVCVARE